MTITEASKTYKIPLALLRWYAAEHPGTEEINGNEYESGKGNAINVGAFHFSEKDIEMLSLIMTLQEIGFDKKEIKTWLRLQQDDKNSGAACLKMLNKLRSETLDAIHLKEKTLDRIDFLRYELQRKAGER